MVAEAVTLSGTDLLIILAALLVLLLFVLAFVALGFVLARRAGRGSGPALAGWIVVLFFEVGWCLRAVAAFVHGHRLLWVLLPPGLIAGQFAVFFAARRNSDR